MEKEPAGGRNPTVENTLRITEGSPDLKDDALDRVVGGFGRVIALEVSTDSCKSPQ